MSTWTMPPRCRAAILPAGAAALLLCSRPAEAHIVSSRLGDFYAGAAHPLTGLQDVVLWTALGVLAGTQTAARARWLAAVFPAGLVAGFLFGLASGVVNGVAAVDAACMVALGGLIAVGVRLPGPALPAIALALGLVRGMANAGGVSPDTNTPLFAAGFAMAGYVAITLLTAAILAFRRSGDGWQSVALRAGGSWIAAIGLMAGGYALAGS